MIANDFNKIIGSISSLINDIRKVNKISEKIDSLISMSKGDYNNYFNHCSNLQSRSDKILKNDLYHIIGMGNLTSAQMSQVLSNIKTLTEIRHILKVTISKKSQVDIARHLVKEWGSVPNAKYQLECNIILEKTGGTPNG
jgi:DNA anti-recombination protein RmuC